MAAPMAVLKAVQVARQAVAPREKRSGLAWCGGGGLVALFGPGLLLLAVIQALSVFFAGNVGASPTDCAVSGGQGAVPGNYSFSLPAWDRDSSKRQQTAN